MIKIHKDIPKIVSIDYQIPVMQCSFKAALSSLASLQCVGSWSNIRQPNEAVMFSLTLKHVSRKNMPRKYFLVSYRLCRILKLSVNSHRKAPWLHCTRWSVVCRDGRRAHTRWLLTGTETGLWAGTAPCERTASGHGGWWRPGTGCPTRCRTSGQRGRRSATKSRTGITSTDRPRSENDKNKEKKNK